MKTAFAFLTLVTFVAAVSADEEPIGRYQLISGIIEMTGKGVVVQKHVIFRIDTKTGDTCSYEIGVGKDGKMREFWSEVPEHMEK